LDELLGNFATGRKAQERIGDFMVRTGVVVPPKPRKELA
jgi:hypothetical protein